MYVYIAGPYTKPDPVANTRKAIAAGEAVATVGHFPFIPHLSMFWHLNHPHDYEFWMHQCFAWLEQCDTLIRLPGFSAGADREMAKAHELGIPIFVSVGDFLDNISHYSEDPTLSWEDVKAKKLETLNLSPGSLEGATFDHGFSCSVSFCCPHCNGSIAVGLESSEG